VENETLSCGTGAVAAALAAWKNGWAAGPRISLETMGGPLVVGFEPADEGYKEIFLDGQANSVFEGTAES
jgi:diaminopimelate epimerase